MPEIPASDQTGDDVGKGEGASRARWRLARRLLLAACVVALLCLAIPKILDLILSLMLWPRDTYLMVRNKTEAAASEVVLRLKGGQGEATERIGVLAPGEERKLRPDHPPYWAELSLVLGERKLRFEIAHVDLWAGETYALELHPGDVLKHGYARDGPIFAQAGAENPK